MKKLIAEWFGEELDPEGVKTLYRELSDEVTVQAFAALQRVMSEKKG